MRRYIAGIGIGLVLLLGVASVASAAPVLPPDEYGPSLQTTAHTTTAPVLPPDEY